MKRAQEEKQRIKDIIENPGFSSNVDYKHKKTSFKPFNFQLSRRLETRVRALLYMDVNLGPGRTGRIGIHEGDDPKTLAKNFAASYKLDDVLTKRLEELIRDNMKKNPTLAPFAETPVTTPRSNNNNNSASKAQTISSGNKQRSKTPGPERNAKKETLGAARSASAKRAQRPSSAFTSSSSSNNTRIPKFSPKTSTTLPSNNDPNNKKLSIPLKSPREVNKPIVITPGQKSTLKKNTAASAPVTKLDDSVEIDMIEEDDIPVLDGQAYKPKQAAVEQVYKTNKLQNKSEQVTSSQVVSKETMYMVRNSPRSNPKGVLESLRELKNFTENVNLNA
ncbi:hypothetical protein AKO1_004778, partial [Acrasis kona]